MPVPARAPWARQWLKATASATREKRRRCGRLPAETPSPDIFRARDSPFRLQPAPSFTQPGALTWPVNRSSRVPYRPRSRWRRVRSNACSPMHRLCPKDLPGSLPETSLPEAVEERFSPGIPSPLPFRGTDRSRLTRVAARNPRDAALPCLSAPPLGGRRIFPHAKNGAPSGRRPVSP